MKAWTKYSACMKDKEIMGIYPGYPFYFTIAYFGNVELHLPKHQ